jgi:hypothetical protein
MPATEAPLAGQPPGTPPGSSPGNPLGKLPHRASQFARHAPPEPLDQATPTCD